MKKKICTLCKEEKLIKEFSRKLSGRASRCKTCSRKIVNEHYKNNKEYYKKKSSKHNKKYRVRNLQYLIDYLKTHPCVDCGEKDPIVLEFDHLVEKTMNVSKMVKSHSIASIDLEISKCEVRCANCHRRKTATQLNWYKNIVL